MLGYPIPLIFLSENEDGRSEIVDGVQRITTLSDFFDEKLVLKKLDKLTTLDGFSISDLPIATKRKLSNTSLRIIVLSDKTSLDTRIDLFNRLNTSAEKANDSEIRNGVLSKNQFQQLINKLAESDLFKEVVHLSKKKTNRKQDIEMVSRFFAYSNNYQNFKHSVKDFITDYIVYIGSSWDSEKSEKKYTEQFSEAFKFAENSFRSGFLHNSKNQTPRVRFEAIMCGIRLALNENPKLKISVEDTDSLLKSEDFINLTTTDGSNARLKVKKRIEYVRDYLLKYGR